MTRRSFLTAVAAALLAGPRALASLIGRYRRPWYEGVRLVKRMGPLDVDGTVFRRWADHELRMASRRLSLEVDRMYYGGAAGGGKSFLVRRAALAWQPQVRPRGSFAEFERRVHAMGFGS